MLNSDYKDILLALKEEKADFIVVGAYALAFHGLPRATGDIDILVNPTRENSGRVYQALVRFGAPTKDISAGTFMETQTVYQIGLPPSRIDIMTSLTGVDFQTCWQHKMRVSLDGLEINVLSRDDLLKNKLDTGRPKDLADAEWLKANPRK